MIYFLENGFYLKKKIEKQFYLVQNKIIWQIIFTKQFCEIYSRNFR